MQKLTCLQAYQVMLRCFDTIYFQTYNDDLGCMMSSAALYSIDQEPTTMDPAAWSDWMRGIKFILNDSSISWDTAQLTVDQAYAAARQYFITYCDIGLFESIGALRDLMANKPQHHQLSQWLKNKWLLALSTVLKEESLDQISFLLTEETTLTIKESFMIMRIFLNMLCQQNHNIELISLIKGCRTYDSSNDYQAKELNVIDHTTWIMWTQAINSILDQTAKLNLDLLSAYQAIPIFLKLYFKNESIFIHKLIEDLESDLQKKGAKNYLFENLWMNCVNDVNAQQLELFYHVISIKTPIKINLIHHIINAWLYDQGLPAVDSKLLYEMTNLVHQKNPSYLLSDDQATVLDAYHIMLLSLEFANQNHCSEKITDLLKRLTLDGNGFPKNFLILLAWLYTVEKVIET